MTTERYQLTLFDRENSRYIRHRSTPFDIIFGSYKHNRMQSKVEKLPRGIQGEKSRKDMVSSGKLVSTIGT